MQERRKLPRVNVLERVEVDLPRPPRLVEACSVNLSEGGMCVRLQEALEIRSPIKLRLFHEARKRPLECAAQVAWVVQRLDLRDEPPFVYDIGVKFVDPPTRLRQLVARAGIVLKAGVKAVLSHPALQPALIRSRSYVPSLQRETAPGTRWHLVVAADEVPCFSQRYESEREAIQGWEQFKSQTARTARGGRI